MGRYLGQHFLKNRSVIEHAVQAILPQSHGILEVGPGAMALTESLLETSIPLILVEKDQKLLHPIQAKIALLSQVTLVHQDVLKFDFLSAYNHFGGPFGLISNLPYLISSPFLEKILPLSNLFTKVYLMLQKEVVEKVLAPSGPKSTKLSHLLRLFYALESGPLVPPQAFEPPPKVDSQFLELNPIPPKIALQEFASFQKFLHQGYNHRNHTLGWFLKKLSAEPQPLMNQRLEDLLTSENPQPLMNQRLEDLSTSDWLEIYCRVSKKTEIF
jgi:16S rRNA (adenine1518-N6/adenine1519-N6)-dimethyltransferase